MYIVSILRTRPKKFNLISKLLMFIEGTDYSHVIVSYKDLRLGIRYVVEARGGGIRLLSNKAFKKVNHVVGGVTYEVTDKTLDEIHKYCYSSLASDYGYKNLVGLGIMRIQQFLYDKIRLKIRVGNPFKDGDYSQICTELAVRVIQFCIKITLPIGVEDYGLKETANLNNKYGKVIPQDKIDQINNSLNKKS